MASYSLIFVLFKYYNPFKLLTSSRNRSRYVGKEGVCADHYTTAKSNEKCDLIVQNFATLTKINKCWANFWEFTYLVFGKILNHLQKSFNQNFHSRKWPGNEQIFQPSGRTAHLSTLVLDMSSVTVYDRLQTHLNETWRNYCLTYEMALYSSQLHFERTNLTEIVRGQRLHFNT